MKRSAWIAALAALATGCGGIEVGTESEAMMGRNGTGPNMMGRNSFVPGGIASNGLGPNYAAEPLDLVPAPSATEWSIRNVRFEAWFRTNPVEHEKAMGYFTRCMLPEGYALTFGANPATGLPYRWPGQYGVAAESLLAGKRMTRDEGLWMSSCMLAHVNIKGTHQYISIRGAKRVPGLATSDGEHWSMRMYHGAYLADLFTSPLEPPRYACQQPRVACSNKENLLCTPPPWYLDIVLGRSCDGYTCSFFNTLIGKQEVLVQNLGWCGDPALVSHSGEAWSPLFSYDAAGTPAGAALRPVFVNGPVFVDFELAVGAPATARTPGSLFEVLSTGTAPVTDKHVVTCAFQSCLRPLWDTTDSYGRKIRLTPGVTVEAMVRYLPTMWATGMEPRAPQIAPSPDMKTQFTAVFRYSNGKTALGRQAAAVAGVAVSDTARQYRKISALWPVTYDGGGKPSWDTYQYLQVWPVTGSYDAAKAGSNPFLMAAASGVANSPYCTGPINGLSLYPSCTLDDSPQLDAVAFVPGKPWCMPAGATSFVGVCPDK